MAACIDVENDTLTSVRTLARERLGRTSLPARSGDGYAKVREVADWKLCK